MIVWGIFSRPHLPRCPFYLQPRVTEIGFCHVNVRVSVTLRCLSHVECSSPQSERSCSCHQTRMGPCRLCQSMSLGFFDQLLAELSDESHPCTVGKLHSEKRNRKLPIFNFLLVPITTRLAPLRLGLLRVSRSGSFIA